ncbi:hypothetical protein G7054_g11299 [Neopestalotiopsis clavispora]|nr:hypothetical protein G7054_g11299 [Neopestalotiopsis clavispora]
MSDSDVEGKDRDHRWDDDARRDRDHQHDHDEMRRRHPPPDSDHDDNQDNEGEEPPPRSTTDDRGNNSRSHTEERGSSSRSHTGDSKGSGTRDRRHHSSRKSKEPSSSSKLASSSKPTSSSKPSSSSKSSSSRSSASSKVPRSRLENSSYVDLDTPNYATYGVEHRHRSRHNSSVIDQPIIYDEPDNSGINWDSWRRLTNGQWHREGQDTSGTWYQEDRDEDPRVPRQLPMVHEDIPYEDPPDDYNNTYNSSGINWGPWRRLPTGQWRREGQDSLGNWYEEYRDDDPRQSSHMAP